MICCVGKNIIAFAILNFPNSSEEHPKGAEKGKDTFLMNQPLENYFL